MIQEQQTMTFSPFMELFELIVPIDNMLRKNATNSISYIC